MIDWLLEKTSIAGVGAVEVSESRLQDYVNQKYTEVPRKINVRQKCASK